MNKSNVYIQAFYDGESRYLPSRKGKIFGCKEGKEFNIVVRFPILDSDTGFRITLWIDDKWIGYYKKYMPKKDKKKGKVTFRGWRANADCSQKNRFLFQKPGEGMGECGKIECEIISGKYEDINPSIEVPVRTPFSFDTIANGGGGSSSTTSCGDLATGHGNIIHSNGFGEKKEKFIASCEPQFYYIYYTH